ncbi:hypothetical protein AA0229_1017 [Gluconobacter cerinus NRIC 0229]|uniref:Uncharacterized protein n=1 Tax=Gluconobacter cerinus TaxID=38307 RepID=A0AAV5NFQ0_9PROT|nr:hypothetical protein AA0229_1017 [Gluconobacter cerinus NRIC 0229]GLQ63222.1 hypothetical protein GCM10007867_20670 [Gluconobacter cerinus]
MVALPPAAGIRGCRMLLVPKSSLFAQILAIQVAAIHASGASTNGANNTMVVGQMSAYGTGCTVLDAATRFGKGRGSGEEGGQSQSRTH